jgi:hypothetical protein
VSTIQIGIAPFIVIIASIFLLMWFWRQQIDLEMKYSEEKMNEAYAKSISHFDLMGERTDQYWKAYNAALAVRDRSWD